MPLTDLPLAELQTYRPDVAEPEDFDAFWAGSIAETRTSPLDLRLDPVDNKLALLDTYDLTFAGWGGAPVRAWLHVPRVPTGRCRRWCNTTATRWVAASRTAARCGPRPATPSW